MTPQRKLSRRRSTRATEAAVKMRGRSRHEIISHRAIPPTKLAPTDAVRCMLAAFPIPRQPLWVVVVLALTGALTESLEPFFCGFDFRLLIMMVVAHVFLRFRRVHFCWTNAESF